MAGKSSVSDSEEKSAAAKNDRITEQDPVRTTDKTVQAKPSGKG